MTTELTTKSRLAKSGSGEPPDGDDPNDIRYMPGYVAPKLRKNWTKAEHCKFANDQLAWRGINEARAKEGLDPVKWIVANGVVMCVFADDATHHNGRLVEG